MNSKKYLPLMLLIASAAFSTNCDTYVPLVSNGINAVEDVTLGVENELTPLFPIETPEGHTTFPMPGDDYGYEKPLLEDGYAKPLPIEDDFIDEQEAGSSNGYEKPLLPVDDENIILPRLDYEEELDILPYEPREYKSNKWYGDKKWRKKNEYGVVDVLPYPGYEEEINILPYPGTGEEVSILPYPQPGDEGYEKGAVNGWPDYEAEQDGFIHGWEDLNQNNEAQNPGGMPEDIVLPVEEAKTA